MEKVKVGQTSLLGYLPAILIKKILEQKQSEKRNPPINMPIKTVSLFADISGFTKLSESFSKKGRKGSEFLAFCLNRYMELLINIIGKNGGDIIKFAGDALLVIWPQEKGGDEVNSCRRALQCALQIITKLDKLEMVKGRVLSVKVGLGFGECKVLLVGGIFDRFECLVVGESMRQACSSECHCQGGGEVVVCESVYNLIQQYYDFEEAPPDYEHGENDGLKYFKLIKAKNTMDKVKIRADAFLMRKKFSSLEIKTKYNELKKFVPAAIAMYLDIEQEIWSKESRLLTIMFLNLSIDLKHTKTQDGLEHIQNIISKVQRCIYRTQGSLNKFLMDDKGSVLLIAWGLPPLSNHDDSLRAVLTGINIIQELKNYKSEKWGSCGVKIGISTGYCFSGICGNIGNRREYSVLGEIVNLAARYMQRSMKICEEKKSNYQLLLCEHTKNLIQSQISCNLVYTGNCKGFSVPFNFYEPIVDNLENIHPHFSLIKTRRDNPKFDLEGNIDEDSIEPSIFILGRDKEVKIILEELNNLTKMNQEEKESILILVSGPLGIGKSILIRRVIYEFFRDNEMYRELLPENNNSNYPFLFVTSQLPTTLTHPFNGCSNFLKIMYNIVSKKNREKIDKSVKIEEIDILCDEYGEFLLKNNYFRLISFLDEILEIDILNEHFKIPEDKIEYIKQKYILHFIDPNFDLYFSKRDYYGYEKDLINYFIALIEEYCEKYIPNTTLMLIIEDTHLIDGYSISLLNQIKKRQNKFIICTYQNNINPYKPQKPSLLEADKEIKLSGLFIEEDVIKLIKYFLYRNKRIKINDIDRKILYIILARSFHNNPLFIIELFDSLYDQNLIKLNEYNVLIASPNFSKSCKLMDWEILNIPFIIEKVVGNIIDSLKCEDIITLKHASVIGAIFDLEKLYKLNIINSLNFEGLKQKIYKYAEFGLLEILYDLDPKKIIVQFCIPFLKEVLYKRMLVETKNEIHLKVARLMGDSKFSYLKRDTEKQLVNYHLIEEEKTILDHLVDTGDDEAEQILKEVNQRIKYLKDTIDTVKDIDTRNQNYNEPELYKQLSLDERNFPNEDINEKKKKEEETEENKLVSNRNMPIVKGGIIEKKSDKGITWEKRFVIITKTKFYYWYTYHDYKSNKLYLGMFELKNIYLIKKLSDYEFGSKTNLLQIRVSSFYKKQELKNGRDYIFSFGTKSELNSWVITLNLLRAKSIYDEFRNTFGIINFPFNHEKVGKEDIRKKKRPFIMPEKNANRRKKSLNFYLMTTQVVDKFIKLKKNKDKLNCNNESEKINLLDEQKTQIESEFSSKLKDRAEFLLTVVLGYFIGVIQKNISCNSIESNNNNYNIIIGEPDPYLVEAIHNSKNYKKMIEEQEKEKNDDIQIIKNNKASTIIQSKIEGENIIPEYAQNNSQYSDNIMINTNKNNITNGFDINEKNNINNELNNINNINLINNEFEKKSNEISNNNNKINNEINNEINDEINIEKNENQEEIKESDLNDLLRNNNTKLSQKDEKNSNEQNDKDNINSNGIDEIKNSEHMKYSHETEDKSDIKFLESGKKEKKKSSFAEKEIDAKDKLKNLKIEVTCKKLEDQIKLLLNEKNIN